MSLLDGRGNGAGWHTQGWDGTPWPKQFGYIHPSYGNRGLRWGLVEWTPWVWQQAVHFMLDKRYDGE